MACWNHLKMEQFHQHFDPNYWKERTRRQNKCDIQMACFDGKKKRKKDRTQQLFPWSLQKATIWTVIDLSFLLGGGVFHFSGSRVSNLLCVRLIAIIIERVSGCNWIWSKQVEAAEKVDILPFPACCVLCMEGGTPSTSKLGAPPGQNSWAGLRSAPAAQASLRAAKWSHSLLMEPLFLQKIKPAGMILQMSWNEWVSETI